MQEQNEKHIKTLETPLWKKIWISRTDEISQQIEIMKTSPLFEDLPYRGLKIIRNRCHQRYYKENEHIFYEGEPGIGMYFIIEGEIEIYTKKRKNKIILSHLGKGDFFGELALFISEIPRSASAIALKNSIILGFFQPDLQVLTKRSPTISNIFLINIIRILGNRLINTNTELEKILSKNYDKLIE